MGLAHTSAAGDDHEQVEAAAGILDLLRHGGRDGCGPDLVGLLGRMTTLKGWRRPVVFWCAWLLCAHSSGAASSVTDPLLENSYATKYECLAVAITKRNQRDAVERKLGRVAERSTFVCLPEGADPLKARME
jgi:hypothetical protein